MQTLVPRLLWLLVAGRSGPQPFTHCWRSLAPHVVILSCSPEGQAAIPESVLASTTVLAPLSEALLELELEPPALALLELAPAFVDVERLLAPVPLVELFAAPFSVGALSLDAVVEAGALPPEGVELEPLVLTLRFKTPASGLGVSPESAAQAVKTAPARTKMGRRMA